MLLRAYYEYCVTSECACNNTRFHSALRARINLNCDNDQFSPLSPLLKNRLLEIRNAFFERGGGGSFQLLPREDLTGMLLATAAAVLSRLTVPVSLDRQRGLRHTGRVGPPKVGY